MKYGVDAGGLTATLDALFEQQLRDWELARLNYSGLERIRVRKLAYPGYDMLVQFNPQRIISSSAKIDQQAILARPCFLCGENRPREQQGIPFHEKYLLLVNPYPIFPGHLTIPSIRHEPQRILPNFAAMLEIARDLPRYTVFYNGPNCGASAPDHFHFQAVPRGHMPVEADFIQSTQVILAGERQGIGIYAWKNYQRNMITFKGKEIVTLDQAFQETYRVLAGNAPDADEPMMNILAGFVQDDFIIHIIPRRLHRPDRYFAAGEQQLLLSPASIDLGGVLILPREEDYIRITREDVRDILLQVCVDEDLIQFCINHLITK